PSSFGVFDPYPRFARYADRKSIDGRWSSRGFPPPSVFSILIRASRGMRTENRSMVVGHRKDSLLLRSFRSLSALRAVCGPKIDRWSSVIARIPSSFGVFDPYPRFARYADRKSIDGRRSSQGFPPPSEFSI